MLPKALLFIMEDLNSATVLLAVANGDYRHCPVTSSHHGAQWVSVMRDFPVYFHTSPHCMVDLVFSKASHIAELKN